MFPLPPDMAWLGEGIILFLLIILIELVSYSDTGGRS